MSIAYSTPADHQDAELDTQQDWWSECSAALSEIDVPCTALVEASCGISRKEPNGEEGNLEGCLEITISGFDPSAECVSEILRSMADALAEREGV